MDIHGQYFSRYSNRIVGRLLRTKLQFGRTQYTLVGQTIDLNPTWIGQTVRRFPRHVGQFYEWVGQCP